jgi:hypothetical protein
MMKTLVPTDDRTDEQVIYDMMVRYRKAKDAKTGEMIECACCSKLIKKTTWQMAFCSNGKNRRNELLGNNNCKDRFWNLTNPTRNSSSRKWLETINAVVELESES